MSDPLLKQSIVHWIQNQNYLQIESFYNLSDCIIFAKIMSDLKFDIFSLEKYNSQTNSNLTLIFENLHTFCNQLEAYYKYQFTNMVTSEKFQKDFNLISVVNEETLEYKLIDIVWYIINAQLQSEEKEKYIQILQNMEEQYQIAVIQFYEVERQNFSNEQLESATSSPIKQQMYQHDQETFYKIKYEEMINILDEKENEILSLQGQLQKKVSEVEQFQKQFHEHFQLIEQKQDEIIIKEKIFFELIQEKNEIISKYSQDPNKPLLQLFQEKEKQILQITKSSEELIIQKDNQIKQLQEQNSLIQLQHDKSVQNYQNCKNKFEALSDMSEQIEKNKKVQEEQQRFLDKQSQLMQARQAEIQEQLSKEKDLNLKQDIEISSLKKKLEISAQQLNEMLEEKQLEIATLKREFDIVAEKKMDGTWTNISEQKGLGSEFSELLEKLEKKQNLEKSTQETKLEEMQQMFTQQDLDHLKKECEAKLQMCLELSAINETMKNENQNLKQQLMLIKHELKQVSEKYEKTQNEQKIILEQIDSESSEKLKMQQEIISLKENIEELEEKLKQQVSQEQYEHLLEEMKKKDKYLEIQKGLMSSSQHPDQLDEEIKLYSNLLYGLKQKFSQTNLLM